MRLALAALIAISVLVPSVAHAGPPFVTDDPEPVELHHWEFYLASQGAFAPETGLATLPHIEVNYGAVPQLQLHLLAPLVLGEQDGAWAYGPGDIELGAKWRFLQESKWIPQVGTFPLVELPVGSAERGLGAGNFQLFVPIWIQKSFGRWTIYGGGGPWFLFGPEHTYWWFAGGLVQRQLSDHFTLGAELFYESAQGPDAPADFRFNIGGIVDVTEHHHILFSVGRAIIGDIFIQYYLAYQLTI